jgi:hypothetical protein
VFSFVHIETRQVHIADMTPSPDALWTRQQDRNLSIFFAEQGKCFSTHITLDRDAKFTKGFKDVLKDDGIEFWEIPPLSPNIEAEGSIRLWRSHSPSIFMASVDLVRNLVGFRHSLSIVANLKNLGAEVAAEAAFNAQIIVDYGFHCSSSGRTTFRYTLKCVSETTSTLFAEARRIGFHPEIIYCLTCFRPGDCRRAFFELSRILRMVKLTPNPDKPEPYWVRLAVIYRIFFIINPITGNTFASFYIAGTFYQLFSLTAGARSPSSSFIVVWCHSFQNGERGFYINVTSFCHFRKTQPVTVY